MKADNESLTYEDKDNLISEARNIFILEPHSNYAEILVAATNPTNLGKG